MSLIKTDSKYDLRLKEPCCNVKGVHVYYANVVKE